MWTNIFPLLGITILLSACNSNESKTISDAEKKQLLLLGDSITSEAQAILLQNVATAIQQGGTDYAVAFCNTQAIPLTDSLSNERKVVIQRLTDKNRNPANTLQTATDSLVWEQFKSEEVHQVVAEKDGNIYYYKPILMAMPACLQCHGAKDDIAKATLNAITQKYPQDKATGYKTGDLRGMWKIKIK